MEEEGTFVGSGSFRIDRARALEMLKAYQTGGAELFAALWVRNAVASSASEIRLSGKANGFELRR